MDNTVQRLRRNADQLNQNTNPDALPELYRRAANEIEQLQDDLTAMEDFARRVIDAGMVDARKRLRLYEEWRHALDTGNIHEQARGE